MKFSTSIGIVAFGSSIPSLSIQVSEIEQAQGQPKAGPPRAEKPVGQVGPALGVCQKTVPDVDQDTVTLSTDALTQALQRFSGKKEEVGALFIGSESHPYAVKPSGTMVAQALGLSPHLALADLQFACKAGTQAIQIGLAYVQSGMAKLAVGIGADTAQSQPGDALEFTAGAGAAAFIMGTDKIIAKVLATTSYATDTPDFWRRPGEAYPQHAGRFTGEPAYFAHIAQATQQLLSEVNLKPAEIDYCVFHTPNGKFPKAVAQQLGFTPEQLQHSLVVEQIGNTYSAGSLMALVNVLETVGATKKILMTSYGSGSGADSFLLETTDLLVQQRKKWSELLVDQIKQLQPITYQHYLQNTSGGD